MHLSGPLTEATGREIERQLKRIADALTAVTAPTQEFGAATAGFHVSASVTAEEVGQRLADAVGDVMRRHSPRSIAGAFC